MTCEILTSPRPLLNKCIIFPQVYFNILSGKETSVHTRPTGPEGKMEDGKRSSKGRLDEENKYHNSTSNLLTISDLKFSVILVLRVC